MYVQQSVTRVQATTRVLVYEASGVDRWTHGYQLKLGGVDESRIYREPHTHGGICDIVMRPIKQLTRHKWVAKGVAFDPHDFTMDP